MVYGTVLQKYQRKLEKNVHFLDEKKKKEVGILPAIKMPTGITEGWVDVGLCIVSLN